MFGIRDATIEKYSAMCFKRHNKETSLEAAKVTKRPQGPLHHPNRPSCVPRPLLDSHSVYVCVCVWAQSFARNIIRTSIWQYTVGFIIVANFIVNIGQACVDVYSRCPRPAAASPRRQFLASGD